MANGFDPEITHLKSTIREVLLNKKPDFDAVWQQTIDEFKTWMDSLPAPLSPLARRQEFLRRLCVNLGNETIRNNNKVQDIVLRGAIEIGQSFNFNGNEYKVIGRSLSPRGVIYRLRDQHGNIMEYEFFD